MKTLARTEFQGLPPDQYPSFENRNGRWGLSAIEFAEGAETAWIDHYGTRTPSKRLRGSTTIPKRFLDDLCFQWITQRGLAVLVVVDSGVVENVQLFPNADDAIRWCVSQQERMCSADVDAALHVFQEKGGYEMPVVRDGEWMLEN